MRDLDRKIADARESQENVSRDRSTYTRREEELLAERDSLKAQVVRVHARRDLCVRSMLPSRKSSRQRSMLTERLRPYMLRIS
jgi:hypothetical protein